MPTSQHQQGALVQADFVNNSGGTNITDSPFTVRDDQCLESYNFDYISTGGLRKRKGMLSLMGSPDTQLKSLGLGMYFDPSNNKTLIRAAGTKLQALDSSAFTATNLSEDTTAAGTDFLAAGSTQPVVFNQFNSAGADKVTGTGNTLWAAGGGLSTIYGATSSTKVTANGAAVPTGVLALSASGSGSALTNGKYWIGAALYKGSTQVTSNVTLDQSITITTGQNIQVDASGLVNPDSTKYTQVWLYASAVAGAEGFTVGNIIAKLDTGTTAYTYNGDTIVSVTNIARAGNILLDNSTLPTGTFKVMTVFKRRLVTASGTTLYVSDINKPESWPLTNIIDIPSGGSITALGVVSFTTPTSSSIEEFLVIFKERELWVVNGDSFDNFNLFFIDSVGCLSQASVVNLNGYLAWIDYRGVYLWNGSGKPIYSSRLIENMFQDDGDLDKSQLTSSWGVYYRKYSQVVWGLSHRSKGTQRFFLKLDLRLSLPMLGAATGSQVQECIFTFDNQTAAGGIYAGMSVIAPGETDETIFIGDDAGQVYKMYCGFQDVASGTDFNYKTKFIDFGAPGVTKRFHKVLVYVNNLGNFNLNLNYWTDYRTSTTSNSTKQLPISPGASSTQALWDVAVWDVSAWDDYQSNMQTLCFNLSSENNNCEGDCLQLQFQQSMANQPVTIYGYSVLYSILGTRK